MAKKTIVQLIDDIDGSKADTTVRFAWQGTAYEIDLSNKNARAFESAVQPYLAEATRAGSGRTTRRGGSRKSKSELSDIRAWAAKNGHSLATRGRIPATVIDAYRSASGGSVAAPSATPDKAPKKAGKVTNKAPRKPRKPTAHKTSAHKASARKATVRKVTAGKATAGKVTARKAAPRRPRRVAN